MVLKIDWDENKEICKALDIKVCSSFCWSSSACSPVLLSIIIAVPTLVPATLLSYIL